MTVFDQGTIVKAHYKTGVYVGEVIEDRNQRYLIQVLAVLKHPQQGDIHHPGQADDVFFHQRKALSKLEKANIPKASIQPFEKEVPDYKDSLKEATQKLKKKLNERNDDYSKKALSVLDELEEHYFTK